jgi:hypothetical protein
MMGFEPPSRTIYSITRQRQCDHDYCAPAFSQVNLLLGKMGIKTLSRRFDFSTVDLKKIAAKHKQIMNKKH